ncbi:hypothetical protein [Faecalimonas sp.]
MDMIESEIEKARNANCFLSALALALTIPSVCSFHQYGKENESIRYPKWYNEYVVGYEKILDGKECYALRCALLHNGDDRLTKQSVLKKNREIYLKNKYHLFVPYVGDRFTFSYEEEEEKNKNLFVQHILLEE